MNDKLSRLSSSSRAPVELTATDSFKIVPSHLLTTPYLPSQLFQATINMAGESALERWMTWAFSPTISAILVAFLISLLSPILIHTYLYRKAATIELPSFLLLGPSGAGKTGLQTRVGKLHVLRCPGHIANSTSSHGVKQQKPAPA